MAEQRDPTLGQPRNKSEDRIGLIGCGPVCILTLATRPCVTRTLMRPQEGDVETPWWNGKRQWRKQGWIVHPKIDPASEIRCPKCKQDIVVYNGNYFCDSWKYLKPGEVLFPGECDWALPHPAITKRDRAFCDLVGIDYF